MANNLTNKERMLLEDQKNHEQICVKKYQNYAQQTNDKELQQLFNSYAQQEQNHLDTINQVLNGQTPDPNQLGSTGSQQQQQSSTTQTFKSAMQDETAAELCTDMLMTEKYVSDTYNTAIFEFGDPAIRQTLNHIQQEEQQHGEGIYNYMNQKGLYTPQ